MKDKNFQWTESAEARISKVPEGFMRNQTRKRIEEHAASRNSREISLEMVEDVIEASRAGMGSMIGGDMSGMPAHVKDMPSKSSKHGTTYFFCFVCNYAVPVTKPEICPNCGSEGEKFSLLEPQYRTEAHTMKLVWSEYAKNYLETIPDGFRRTMSKNEIEAFSRREGYKVVTGDVIDERLKVWEGISKKMVSLMEWEEGVLERVNRIPERIRGMVIREMELFSQRAGENIVTMKTLDAIREKWVDSREFHVKWQ